MVRARVRNPPSIAVDGSVPQVAHLGTVGSPWLPGIVAWTVTALALANILESNRLNTGPTT
jgi:hypothetical protein